MGYTHYFYFTEDIKKFDKNVLSLVKSVCDDFKDIIQFEYNDNKPPLITSKLIRFNGIDDDGHETFMISTDTTRFCFCKTARKDYDLPVCIILLILKSYYKDKFSLSSDGINKKDNSNDIIFDGSWLEAFEYLNKNKLDIPSVNFNIIARGE